MSFHASLKDLSVLLPLNLILTKVSYQGKTVKDVKMFPAEQEQSFCRIETLNSGAAEHVADLLAVLEEPHHRLFWRQRFKTFFSSSLLAGLNKLECLLPASFLVQPNIWLYGLQSKKLMLSSSFRCDQIYDCQRYDFGHTLLCY